MSLLFSMYSKHISWLVGSACIYVVQSATAYSEDFFQFGTCTNHQAQSFWSYPTLSCHYIIRTIVDFLSMTRSFISFLILGRSLTLLPKWYGATSCTERILAYWLYLNNCHKRISTLWNQSLVSTLKLSDSLNPFGALPRLQRRHCGKSFFLSEIGDQPPCLFAFISFLRLIQDIIQRFLFLGGNCTDSLIPVCSSSIDWLHSALYSISPHRLKEIFRFMTPVD